MGKIKDEAKKILVVDDERDVRDILYELLTYKGFEVKTADNGVAALKKLSEASYDLLITDINMPKMDGFELLDRIYQSNIKVTTIVMSSFIPVTIKEYAKRRKVYGYVSKPFHIGDIIDVVENGLGRI